MRVTIEINPTYLDRLRKWASVQRTLDTASAGCEAAAGAAGADPRDVERFRWCDEELSVIGPAISWLHHAVRDEIWRADAAADKT